MRAQRLQGLVSLPGHRLQHHVLLVQHPLCLLELGGSLGKRQTRLNLGGLRRGSVGPQGPDGAPRASAKQAARSGARDPAAGHTSAVITPSPAGPQRAAGRGWGSEGRGRLGAAQAGSRAEWSSPPFFPRTGVSPGGADLVSGCGQALNQVLGPLVLLALDAVAAALPVQLQLHLLPLQALLSLRRQGQLLLIPGVTEPASAPRAQGWEAAERAAPRPRPHLQAQHQRAAGRRERRAGSRKRSQGPRGAQEDDCRRGRGRAGGWTELEWQRPAGRPTGRTRPASIHEGAGRGQDGGRTSTEAEGEPPQPRRDTVRGARRAAPHAGKAAGTEREASRQPQGHADQRGWGSLVGGAGTGQEVALPRGTREDVSCPLQGTLLLATRRRNVARTAQLPASRGGGEEETEETEASPPSRPPQQPEQAGRWPRPRRDAAEGVGRAGPLSTEAEVPGARGGGGTESGRSDGVTRTKRRRSPSTDLKSRGKRMCIRHPKRSQVPTDTGGKTEPRKTEPGTGRPEPVTRRRTVGWRFLQAAKIPSQAASL